MNTPQRDDWPTDGWRTADPADHGLDPAGLDAARDHLREHTPHMDSLLVVRGGYLLYEWYGDTGAPDALRNVKSVTKSVTSLLTGIALDTGDLGDIDEPVGFILPEAFSTVKDRIKRGITIKHLLTMRSGLDWQEYGPDVVQMTASPDWRAYVLNRPLAYDPGSRFNYSTGDTHLLAAALQKLVAMSLLEYADLYLFGPLGITERAWTADPQGVHIGGAELQLTARAMAKIGYLALKRGTWDGARIVSAAWIAESHTPQVELERQPDECSDLSYGYLWWLRGQGGHASGVAVGFGGQFITVIPALDMVVVMTGNLKTAPDAFRDNRMLCQFNLVEDYIVPATAES